MTKQDKIFAVLRKLDYEWGKKGSSFSQVVKQFMKAGSEFDDTISDDQIIENIKSIYPDDKEVK